MGPNLLLQEIALALLGALGIWALQVITPLQGQASKVLQVAVAVATVLVMARIGGLL